MTCWRCKAAPVARLRLRPWKRGALCRPCANEVDAALLDVAVTAIAFRILTRPRAW